MVDANQSSAPSDKPRLGKDHLNLADWRVSTASNQQTYKKDGSKVDFVEYVIRRAGSEAMSVTLESPATIGLPTAADEDVIIGLLALAKEQRFESDTVHFVPSKLLSTMGLSIAQKNFHRLERSLKRLRAVTLTYKLAWYDRKKAAVEPILITGVLSEAKLVLRKGRRPTGEIPDSYVQWTKNFYQSLKDGNLTDLNLDLYFNWERPGSKHLYRHLNKVWHAGKKPKLYERDLKELACGHLGMTENKDLKRNLHRIITEMESKQYLQPMPEADRYQKVRPGVWRVRFEIHPHQLPTPKTGGGESSKNSSSTGSSSTASDIVRAYHHHRFGRSTYDPTKRELEHAETLLMKHDEVTLQALIPRVAKSVAEKSKDDLYFGFAVPFFHAAIQDHEKKRSLRRKQHETDSREAAEEKRIAAQKHEKADRRHELLSRWRRLPSAAQLRYKEEAIDQAASDFDRRRMHRANLDNPPMEILELLSNTLTTQ